jgi:cysteamine dioxygenase
MTPGLELLTDLVRQLARDPLPAGRSEALVKVLDALTLDDLGVRGAVRRAWAMRGAQWFSHPVVTDAAFHIDVFVLPRGALIPLHDHPGMRVWLRVLEGTPRVRAFHPVERTPRGWVADIDYDKVLTPDSEPLVITPERGCLHSVHGAWDVVSAFIDVSIPPYDEASGRGCTYYVEGKPVTREGKAYAHLTRGE